MRRARKDARRAVELRKKTASNARKLTGPCGQTVAESMGAEDVVGGTPGSEYRCYKERKVQR